MIHVDRTAVPRPDFYASAKYEKLKAAIDLPPILVPV